jgi:hypothetical protein
LKTLNPTFYLAHVKKSVWYCGSFCGYGLKKIIFIKNTYSWGWFSIYVYFIKTVVEIEVEQKVV